MFLHRRIYLFSFLISSLLLSSACTEKDRSIYFPLANRMIWQYNVTMEYTRRSIESKLILENIGSKIINGNSVFTKRDHAGNNTYFFQTKNFILKNSTNPSLEETDKNKESYFVLPLDIKKGDKWRLQSRPYVMEHAMQYEVALQTSTPAVKLSKPLYIDYQLISLDEKIKVPAGTFKHCAKIVGLGSCKMAASGGNFSGSIDVNIEHTNWYCPGVGLTKTIRKEVDPGGLYEPVTYHQELEKLVAKNTFW